MTNTSPIRSYLPWIAGASVVALSMGAGVWALSSHAIDPTALLGSINGLNSARPAVAVGAVANGAGIGGDDVVAAARAGLDDGLAGRTTATPRAPAASRGARVLAGRGGHVIDANVVRVARGPGRVTVEASVVVSSMSGRAYEFSSSSTITITGDAADTDDGLRDAVRRATRSAATHAVDQMGGR